MVVVMMQRMRWPKWFFDDTLAMPIHYAGGGSCHDCKQRKHYTLGAVHVAASEYNVEKKKGVHNTFLRCDGAIQDAGNVQHQRHVARDAIMRSYGSRARCAHDRENVDNKGIVDEYRHARKARSAQGSLPIDMLLNFE
jgi:hypothetical protein